MIKLLIKNGNSIEVIAGLFGTTEKCFRRDNIDYIKKCSVPKKRVHCTFC